MQRQENSKSKQSLSFETVPLSKLREFFTSSNLLYKDFEIRYAQDLAEKINHPVISEVLRLLNQLDFFLDSTTLDSTFKKYRDQTKKDPELMAVLDSLNEILKLSEKKLKELKPESDDYQVLSLTYHFAINCIKGRLAELKSADDKLFKLFNQKKESGLKERIESYTKRPFIK